MGQTVNLLAYAFGGSNPSLPTKNCGSSSVDRALAFQAEGRGFEPRLPLSREILIVKLSGFLILVMLLRHFMGQSENPVGMLNRVSPIQTSTFIVHPKDWRNSLVL